MPKGDPDDRRGAPTRCEVCNACAVDKRAASYCIYGGPFAGYQQRAADDPPPEPIENEGS